MTIRTGLCCAFREINGLEEYTDRPNLALAHFLKLCQEEDSGEARPYVLFTGITAPAKWRGIYDVQFAEAIKKYNLGPVQELPNHKNWTGSTIRPWLWEIDYSALRELISNDQLNAIKVDSSYDGCAYCEDGNDYYTDPDDDEISFEKWS